MLIDYLNAFGKKRINDDKSAAFLQHFRKWISAY